MTLRIASDYREMVTPIDHFPAIGRTLILLGSILMLAGLLLVLAPKLPFLGRLPGDIVAGDDRVVFYFPVVTMILVSVVLTLALNLLPRFFK